MRTNRKWIRRKFGFAATLLAVGVGCASSRTDVSYLGDSNVSYYRGHATDIDYPALQTSHSEEVVSTLPPLTVRDKTKLPIRDISLTEAVQTALMNSQIIRSAGTFLSTGNALYTNPDRIPSVYDPAIQESGVLFGGRGVEAALSAFDAQLQTSMIWGRSENPVNNPVFGGGVGGGSAFIQETGNFNSSLSKSFGNGSSISVSHDVNYLGTNSPSLFQSAYSGNLQFQFQQPLLAGAGTEFTRTAGPIGQSFGGISGVSQGVLIARINNDITLADFETSVRNLVSDVENAYWDLYLAYQVFDVAVEARDSTDQIRNFTANRVEAGAGLPADLFQAEDQFFAAETAVANAQSEIYQAEIRLRRLLGLSVNDGEILRTIDTPVSGELVADWYTSLAEALTQRVELRRQKWNIKSLQLQLRAAESLTRPRLDFIGGYQVNGFGDDLIGYDEPRFDNFYETVADGNYTGWNMGLQMRMDIGFRSAKAQVQNYELRLAKANKVLLEQEEEISHELAISFQELARAYRATETSYNRINSVVKEVEKRELAAGQTVNVDVLLRTILRKGEAQAAYYRNLIAYNKAITDFQLRRGALLKQNGVMLAEGGWEAGAYEDAMFNSDARLYAEPNDKLTQEPPAFSGKSPYGGVYFNNQSASDGFVEPLPASDGGLQPITEEPQPTESQPDPQPSDPPRLKAPEELKKPNAFPAPAPPVE